MKHSPKFILMFLLCSFIVITSCEEEPEVQELNEVEFTFNELDLPIDQSIIDKLDASSDNRAREIAYSLEIANQIKQFLSYFDVRASSMQSTTPIAPCGGNAFVSLDMSLPDALAYQICEAADKYIFQVLIDENKTGDFDLFFYAEESKSDLREGLLRIHPRNPNDVALEKDEFLQEYTWTENAEGVFFFRDFIPSSGLFIDTQLNPDNSGLISYGGLNDYVLDATWNATATEGTFTVYINDVVTESGIWSGN